jgi:hypothetical protein
MRSSRLLDCAQETEPPTEAYDAGDTGVAASRRASTWCSNYLRLLRRKRFDTVTGYGMIE